MFKYLAVVPFLLPSFAPAQSAQSATSTDDRLVKEDDDRWTLGMGVSVTASPYLGEGTRARPFPLITYDGERIFWRGLSGGVHVFKGESVTLDVILSGRFDGFDIEDLSRSGLVSNGLAPNLLEDRDDGLDLGLAVTWEGRAGQIKLRALADATDTSSGYELSADYGYPLQFGRTTVVPGIGVSWMSEDLVSYYYGTVDEEIVRGVPVYQPGSALVPQISVGFMRPLGKKWNLFGSLEYELLPDEISDSPLLERDTRGSASLKIGISRSF